MVKGWDGIEEKLELNCSLSLKCMLWPLCRRAFHVFHGDTVKIIPALSAFYPPTCLSFAVLGPVVKKLMMSLVNVSLKFQTAISNICQYFLLKKCEKLLQRKSFSHFFNKKYQCIWL